MVYLGTTATLYMYRVLCVRLFFDLLGIPNFKMTSDSKLSYYGMLKTKLEES